MADVFDSGSCDDVIQSNRNDSLVDYVIQHALMDSDEEIPEGGDDFWKPVTSNCCKEEDISACNADTNYGNLNLNRHNVSNVSCRISNGQAMNENNDSSGLDKSSLRKSVSDDSIAFKRQEDIKREIPDELFPSFQSEKGSPEVKHNQRQSYIDSEDFESSSSDEEIDPAEDKFDFFREYEMKIDSLEYCDMAVEEYFEILKHHVLELANRPKTDGVKGNKESRDDGNIKEQDNMSTNEIKEIETELQKEGKNEIKTCTSPLTVDEVDSPADVQVDSPAEVNVVSPSDIKVDITTDTTVESPTRNLNNLLESNNITVQEKAAMVVEILKILRDRFEKFIAEVSEVVHLGALSVRHAQRVDQWGAEVQKTYQKIYADHQNMKAFLLESEAKWAESREQYQTEIVRQGQQITDILRRLHIFNEEAETSSRHNDKQKASDVMNNVLMKRRGQEEHAMALDFARQSKISELKLLIIEQQSYIQRLQLKNEELNSIISDVLYVKPESTEESREEETAKDGQHLQSVADVLYCDQTSYIPNKSVDPDIVGRQVFNIGNTKTQYGQAVQFSPTRQAFDPHKLSYICLDALTEQSLEQCDEENTNIDDKSEENKEYFFIEKTHSMDDAENCERNISPEVAENNIYKQEQHERDREKTRKGNLLQETPVVSL